MDELQKQVYDLIVEYQEFMNKRIITKVDKHKMFLIKCKLDDVMTELQNKKEVEN